MVRWLAATQERVSGKTKFSWDTKILADLFEINFARHFPGAYVSLPSRRVKIMIKSTLLKTANSV
jgi:hypothetical protein